jgi:hypothetical protein
MEAAAIAARCRSATVFDTQLSFVPNERQNSVKQMTTLLL